MAEIIKISDPEIFIDFQEFLQDPNVKILEETNNEEGRLYSFNTGEKILISKSLQQDDDRIIFGKDKTPNIVNMSVNEGSIDIYQEIDGVIKKTTKLYDPWILTKDKFSINSKRLKGNQYYKHITYLPKYRYDDIANSWNNNIWNARGIQESYMLLHGATYFKDMKVEDVSILSFDIETTTLNPYDSNAEVLLISNTYRKSGSLERKLFDIHDYGSETGMIAAWCDWVKEVDPSILLGHNIFGFDLNYLYVRSNENLPLGRDNNNIYVHNKPYKFRKDGSQQYDYYNVLIPGRELIDTFFLSIKYDIGRKFPSYGLKNIEKHLNLIDNTRIDWDFNTYKTLDYKNWPKDKWEDFKEYCRVDGDSPIKMFDIMIPPFFYFAQSVPKTLQQVINEASGSALDSIMIRSYLQDGYSQPKTSGKAPFEGAISMGIPGIYKNVVKKDVASLYPSIMLNYNIYNKNKDPNGHQIKILKYLTEQRLRDKELGKNGSIYHQQLSDSRKISINSFYGFMGAGRLLYNYPEGAALVTRYGRDVLQKGVEWATGYNLKRVIKKIKNKGKENEEIEYEWVLGDKISEGRGYTLVNVDTDSFSVTNGKLFTDEELDNEAEQLNSIYPSLIKWEPDGIFSDVIVVKAKNYVLKSAHTKKLKIKGSSLIDQKKEPALTELLKKLINGLLEKQDLVNIYNEYIKEVMNIKDISRWATKKTVTKSILNPTRTNEQKVLDALDGKNIQEGDKIWLYTAIDPKDEKKTILKLSKNWDNDEATEHYLKRVWSTVKILENVLNIKDFPKYHLKTNKKALDKLLGIG